MNRRGFWKGLAACFALPFVGKAEAKPKLVTTWRNRFLMFAPNGRIRWFVSTGNYAEEVDRDKWLDTAYDPDSQPYGISYWLQKENTG